MNDIVTTLLLALLALLPPGVHAQDAQPADPRPSVRAEGDVLLYTGQLNGEGLAALRAQLAAHPGLSSIRIDSRGGDPMSGIEIGKALRARNLAVVVSGRCNSACANYVFVPAARRTILPGAMVLWHNSCPQNIPPTTRMTDVLAGRHASIAAVARPVGEDMQGKTVEDLLADSKASRRLDRRMKHYFRDWARAHTAFFADVPVDGRAMCLGDYVSLPGGSGYGYTLSVEDMQALGLCNVQASPTYVQDVVARLAAEGKSRLAGVVRLSDYPDFQPRRAGAGCSAQATGGAGQ